MDALDMYDTHVAPCKVNIQATPKISGTSGVPKHIPIAAYEKWSLRQLLNWCYNLKPTDQGPDSQKNLRKNPKFTISLS